MKYRNRNLESVTLPNSFNGTYPRSKQVMCPCGRLSCGSRAHGQPSISSGMKDIHSLSVVSKDSRHDTCFPALWCVDMLMLEIGTSQQEQGLYLVHKALPLSKKTVQLSSRGRGCMLIGWWEPSCVTAMTVLRTTRIPCIRLCRGLSREENFVETRVRLDLTITLESTVLSKVTHDRKKVWIKSDLCSYKKMEFIFKP